MICILLQADFRRYYYFFATFQGTLKISIFLVVGGAPAV